MNTNALKKFAQQARRKLIELVTAKLNYVLTADSAELREKASQIQKLKDALKQTSQEAVIEKVAYTWFNRLMALRYMDANAYQPIGMSVVTPKQGYTLPEILDEAKQGNISTELIVNQQEINDLLDEKTPNPNPQNEVYKILLIAACNHLNKVFPFLFERIDDYTELLLPDDLLSELSIVAFMREGMTVADCQEVEIIGWLYQFYISEKKDEVFAAKAAVKKEDIPAATQLFTPRWIVEYMVQNTLGKLWLQNRPNSRLRELMPYYIESAAASAEDFLKINSVEEITLLDQACGSGHILVYGFELFSKIYEEEGYNPSEIPALIIEKNLFGFEIDERAAQLAGLALMMKARSGHKRFFRKQTKPNILCYRDFTLSKNAIADTCQALGIADTLFEQLSADLHTMQQATNYGSLIIPKTEPADLEKILSRIAQQTANADVFLSHNLAQLKPTIEQLLLLSQRYHCLVANPPYMGGGKMNEDLSKFVKLNFPDAKADLITCFVERGLLHLPPNGFSGLVTMESWMFLASFEDFRKKLLENITIHSLSHFGWHIMRIAFGTVAFIFENKKPTEKTQGVYSYMENDNIDKEKERPVVFPIIDNGRYKTVNQKDFEKIPGRTIGYWLSSSYLKSFKLKKINDIFTPKQGLATGKNERFMRYWFEIPNISFYNNYTTFDDCFSEGANWVPYSKGGAFRKWYGNNDFVVYWKDSGQIIRNFKDSNGKELSRFRAANYYFREAITWSLTSSANGGFACRMRPKGFVFDINGMSLFDDKKISDLQNVACLLNSVVGTAFLKVINPTMAYQIGDIASVPYHDAIIDLKCFSFETNVEISKQEWDSKETSWDFQANELLRIKGKSDIDLEEAYDLYKAYWQKKFFELHRNEEALNRQFIEIYGLQDELTPNVPLEDITILKEETVIQNNQIVFKATEVFAQFMSYAVGCMFGRYSLDKDGLILANQGETLEDYFQKIGTSTSVSNQFLPDEDNIIPVLDDEWFEDDIVGRFKAFLKASFGATNFDKNLAFVEECLGKDIRKYFVKDFYNDHIKRYKKRPIYWQFSSAKGAFNVLIYMHRYTPDTLGKILNDYLMQYREKLKSHIEHLNNLVVSGSSIEQTKAAKEIEKLKVVLVELKEYEVSVLYPLVQERISIDLDEGVLVNYNKFGKAIKEVAGLNDTATKKKVREFEWINTAEIR